MKVFHCDSCEQLLFFENVVCVRCGHVLAFLPDTLEMAALEPVENDIWRSLAPHSVGNQYRLCANYVTHAVCNWAVPADSPDPLCSSCRLTRVIPDMSLPENNDAWRKLEAAKRRLLYSLLNLGLPLKSRQEDPELGLAFEFLGDAAPATKDPVLTGHDSGVITINIAEADDAEREKRRMMLHEPYRTLLGHLRHEIGHYYWDVIVQNSDQLLAFRSLFGDDRQDYAEALKRHYEQGPSPDWQDHFISAYASSHPWEDWAETWAHYLHMTDALETAAASGIIIAPPEISQSFSPADIVGGDIRSVPFDTLVEHWLPLAYALNNLNRSLGLPDGYPFVLFPAAIEKLRFTHEIIRSLHQPDRTRNQLNLAFTPPV
jgi:hypothetical protein